MTLAWSASTTADVTGYNVYYGAASQTYTNMLSVGNVTNATVSGLVQGSTYYFSVTAVDSLGLESPHSNEISYTVPTTNTAPVNPLPAIVLSSPADGTVFTAPADITLNASVTANGHTITGVQFYNGSTLLGQVTTAPYSFTWNNVAAGSYTLSAIAIYDSGNTVASAASTVTVQSAPPPPMTPGPSLPLPWQSVDIGAVGAAGSATVSNGLYTVAGAGNLSGSADNFQFVYQSLSGDGEIACQVTSVGKTGGGSCVGVMIRESLTSGSRYALMGMSGNGQFRALRRTASSGSTSATKAGQASPPNAWVRLVRSGDTLSSYRSVDGASWTLVNSTTIPMAANIYVGLGVASGSSTVLNTSAFANVSVVP